MGAALRRVETSGYHSNLEEAVAMQMWPTPVGDDTGTRKKKYAQGGTPLSMAVNEGQSMWPTPTTRDWKGGSGTIEWKNGRFVRVSNTTGIEYGATLDGAVGIWPTPQVDDAKNVYPKENRRETLVSRVNKWPTPRVSDTEGGKAHNVELHNGSFSRTNKDGVRWGVKLRDAVESSTEA